MKSTKLMIFILWSFGTIFSCGSIIDKQKNLSNEDRINEKMSELCLPSQMSEGETVLTSNPADSDYLPDDEVFIYQKKQFFTVPNMCTFFVEDLPACILWPGAIIDSASFVNGSEREICSPDIIRAPLQILMDEGYAGRGSTVMIEHPEEMSVKKAIKDLIKQRGVCAEASRKYSRYVFSEFKTKSEFEIKLKTIAGYRNILSGDELGAVNNKSTSNRKAKIIFRYIDCFFSIKPASLLKASDFFNINETSWDDIAPALGNTGTAPVFVSSVDYGKSIIAVIESDEDYESIMPGIEAYGSYLDGEVDENIIGLVHDMKTMSTIMAAVVGEKNRIFTSFEDFEFWLWNKRNIESGKPIGYSMQYIPSPMSSTPAKFVVGGDYYERRYKWHGYSPTYLGRGEYDTKNGIIEIPSIKVISSSSFYPITLDRFSIKNESFLRISGEVISGGFAYSNDYPSEKFQLINIIAGEKFIIRTNRTLSEFVFFSSPTHGCTITNFNFEVSSR